MTKEKGLLHEKIGNLALYVNKTPKLVKGVDEINIFFTKFLKY